MSKHLDTKQLESGLPVFSDPLFKKFCTHFEGHGPGGVIGREHFRLWVEIASEGSRAMAEGKSVAQAAVDELMKRHHVADKDRQQLGGITELFGEIAARHEFEDILGPACSVMNAHNTHRGQFFTPAGVSDTMTAMLLRDLPAATLFGREKTHPFRILDMFSGTGSLVLAAAKAIHEVHGDYGLSRCSFWGLEIDPFMIKCLMLQARIHGMDSFGLTLRRYQAASRGEREPEVAPPATAAAPTEPPEGVHHWELRTTVPEEDDGKFDLCIANPPWGIKIAEIPAGFPIGSLYPDVKAARHLRRIDMDAERAAWKRRQRPEADPDRPPNRRERRAAAAEDRRAQKALLKAAREPLADAS